MAVVSVNFLPDCEIALLNSYTMSMGSS